MLAFMELDDEQRKEILTGMDPTFRHFMFQQPFALLLPWPLRRLLMGRAAATVTMSPGRTKAPSSSQLPSVCEKKLEQNTAALLRGFRPTRSFSAERSESSVTEERCAPPLQRKCTVDNLLEVVRGMEGVARTSKAAADMSVLERIFTEKMMGKTVLAARQLVGSAQAKAFETFEYSKEKVCDIGEGVREAACDPRTQVAAASAVGGAVALGSGGAATGLVSGGVIGAVCGLVPAIFTFGLSIPIGAAIGGGVGCATGATVAGTAGFLGGGTVGYHAYGSSQDARAKALKES
mmetsp:Transcript_71192/g.204144  ORF Transcript_71192/g.204144 Transcript_71192/m.204144 type:complete len:292 (+) Transcript_71192:3-878(+)